MHFNKITLGFVSGLFCAGIVNAGSMGHVGPSYDSFHGGFNFSIGGFNATQGQAQHINIVGLLGNDYTVSNQNDQNVLVGLGYFFDGANYNGFNLAYGINAFYLANTRVKGTVIWESLFTDLSYQYRVAHLPVYAAAKATLNSANPRYNITMDVGIGPNFMMANHYSEASLDGGISIPDNGFSDRTTTTFSVTAGIGVKFNQFWQQRSMELGYRFFYLGRGDFNTRSNQFLSHLKTGDSYANAIVLTLTI